MANKLQKYRDELERNDAKIAQLKERNSELERRIAEAESLEIRALLRSENITLEQLMALARSRREGDMPVLPVEEPAAGIAVNQEEKQEELTEDEEDDDYEDYE